MSDLAAPAVSVADGATTVWKYGLPSFRCVVPMPAGAQVLSVAAQHGQPVLWAAVDRFAPEQPRMFAVISTGQQLPEMPKKFLGTVLPGGDVVLHVFEVGTP